MLYIRILLVLILVFITKVEIVYLLDAITVAFWLLLNLAYIAKGINLPNTFKVFLSFGHIGGNAVNEKLLSESLICSAVILSSLMLVSNFAAMNDVFRSSGIAMSLMPIVYSGIYFLLKKRNGV